MVGALQGEGIDGIACLGDGQGIHVGVIVPVQKLRGVGSDPEFALPLQKDGVGDVDIGLEELGGGLPAEPVEEAAEDLVVQPKLIIPLLVTGEPEPGHPIGVHPWIAFDGGGGDEGGQGGVSLLQEGPAEKLWAGSDWASRASTASCTAVPST